LLSERNIKIALYSGGLLLVLAGLIFIGVNWTRIPGSGKFAITLLVTGLMYFGGYLLFKRPAYTIGGIALLAIASGFLTLNFAVLQIYVLGPSGLPDDVMWLIASPICLIAYGLTAYWSRSDLFVYFSQAAIVSTVTAALVVFDAPELVYLLAYSLLAFVLLVLARYARTTPWSELTYLPLLYVSQVAMPTLLIMAVIAWIEFSGCIECTSGSPWLAIIVLGMGVLFYVFTNATFKWLAARWAAVPLFALVVAISLIELDFSDTVIAVTLMLVSLALLVLGNVLERKEEQRAGGWPFYATAYAVALLVTIMAIPETEDLIKVLFGDVALLAISAAIFRAEWCVYGAAWLCMVPVYLLINLNVPVLRDQGLLMGLLGLIYVAIGYIVGRRTLRQGGPFLTAGAFLSILTVALVSGDLLTTSIILIVIALLYTLMALWIGWTWLLYPALFALNLCVFTVNDYLIEDVQILDNSLIISYAILGMITTFGGLLLRRSQSKEWAWPLYVTGSIDLIVAYAGGLVSADWLAVSISALLAGILLSFTWFEREEIRRLKLPPLLTYLSLLIIFGALFYVLHMIGEDSLDSWPAFAAGLCAVFLATAELFRGEPWMELFGVPLRFTGMSLMAIPMIGAVIIFEPLLAAVTFAIAGIAYAAEAALQKIVELAYLSVGSFVVVIAALLMYFEVTEPQAYTIPVGVAFLGVGWNERLRGQTITYRVATLLGLVILMGSAFFQSLPQGEYIYAYLLGFESLVAVAWGIHTHSRGYVQLGVLALFMNAVVQFGPAFLELPRWIQIGVTGSILLGIGLAALFKRDEILTARKKLADDWRQWEP
jgi:hypothetical protein